MIRSYICSFFLLGTIITLSAQDASFSLFHQLPEVISSVATYQAADQRTFHVQYRQQWSAIESPYRHFAAYGQIQRKRISLGGFITQEDAGPASLRTTEGRFQLSVHQPLAEQNNTLSLGFGLGVIQRRIDPAALQFASQWDTEEGFAGNLPSEEVLAAPNQTRPNLSAGLRWSGQLGHHESVLPFAAIGLDHLITYKSGFLNTPINSFRRMSLIVGCRLLVNEKLSLTPQLLHQRQGSFRELSTLVKARYQIKDQQFIAGGLGWRKGDAALLQIGWGSAKRSIWIAYDQHRSELAKATQGQGAFELSLRFHFGAPKRKSAAPERIAVSEATTAPPATNPTSDMDGDGLLDGYDKCPRLPGLACFEGCPDSDQDGVIDPLDSCPNLHGHPDNQGCPFLYNDADGDGVLDDEDYCIYIKGSIEFRGCPDTDGDGVSDIQDNCPYLAGEAGNKGCPIYQQIDNTTTQPTSQHLIVTFATDEALLNPTAVEKLSALAHSLTDYPAYRLILTGHTDENASASYNYSLGQKRSLAVRGMLIRLGIPASKIEYLSYGEHIPLADNATAAGRSMNRRVEVNVIPE